MVMSAQGVSGGGMTSIADAVDEPGVSTAMSRSFLLRRFLRGAAGYWKSPGSRLAWTVTVSLTLVVFVSLGITYGINLWNRYFFDALGAKNAPAAFHDALIFPVLVAVYLLLCGTARYRAVRVDGGSGARIATGDHHQCGAPAGVGKFPRQEIDIELAARRGAHCEGRPDRGRCEHEPSGRLTGFTGIVAAPIPLTSMPKRQRCRCALLRLPKN